MSIQTHNRKSHISRLNNESVSKLIIKSQRLIEISLDGHLFFWFSLAKFEARASIKEKDEADYTEKVRNKWR
ncbi:hypothetical protein JW823_10330 [bacterium]|nr:hypothetical protein [candidate division CSSED10-310 bacterium]